jgi:site-specific recombinase XerD
MRRFRLIVCGWLRFAGRLHEPDRTPGPHQGEVDAYCRCMEEDRGLSPATIATARHHLKHFFAETTKRPLRRYVIAHIEQYLAGLGAKGWTRNGIRTLAYHLRDFFLYVESQRWTKPGLGVLIRGPRIYRRERPPTGPSWPDVQRLLASTETNLRADIRDRGILLLLAVYGLRVGEVRRLCLENVDWERRTLTIVRTKQRRPRICPLIPTLADALTRYIHEVRPPTPYREIFIRLNAPHKPFRHGGMWGIVANRFRRLGIKSELCGPHSLRHACATHLLAQGLTLTEVGGHLGHSTAEATLVYAKVDMKALRVVADLDLGGLL